MQACSYLSLTMAVHRPKLIRLIAPCMCCYCFSTCMIFSSCSRLWLYSRFKPSSGHNVTPAKAPDNVETLGQLSGHILNGFVPATKNGYVLHGKELELADHVPRMNGFTHFNGLQPTISLQPHVHTEHELGVTIIKVG